MIPQIIHYIWLGQQEMPIELQNCVDSWKKHMPKYEFRLWDDDSIKDIDFPFIREAIREKKYAFATDVIRLWALEKYGGVYLDTDVKVLKSFDSLLSEHAFIGREKCMQIDYHTTSYHLTSYCLGAEKGNAYIKACLEYYENRHFVTSSVKNLPNHLRYDMRNASYIYSEIARSFGYNPSALAPNQQKCLNNVLSVLPPSAFADGTESSDSFCKHLSFGTWRDAPQDNITYNLKYKIEWRITSCVESFLRKFGYIMIKIN